MEYNELSEEAKENALEEVKSAESENVYEVVYDALYGKLIEEVGQVKDINIRYKPNDSVTPISLLGYLYYENTRNLPFEDVIYDGVKINISCAYDEADIRISTEDKDLYTEHERAVLKNVITDWYWDTVDKLTAYADDLMEFYNSDEFLEEQANDYSFDKNGNIIS